jgi:hypothetical protein
VHRRAEVFDRPVAGGTPAGRDGRGASLEQSSEFPLQRRGDCAAVGRAIAVDDHRVDPQIDVRSGRR